MHAEATTSITTNLQALQKQPGFTDRSIEDLTKLAYWRGVVAEENKLQPANVKDDAVARVDKQAQDPQFLKRLDQETGAKVKGKTTERVQQRETPEQSLQWLSIRSMAGSRKGFAFGSNALRVRSVMACGRAAGALRRRRVASSSRQAPSRKTLRASFAARLK